MGNPSSHASHLASQWLKKKSSADLSYLLSPYIAKAHFSAWSTCMCYLGMVWIAQTALPLFDPMHTEWSQEVMVSACSASGGSDGEQRHRPWFSSFSDMTGDAISTNQLTSHSSLSPPCSGKHNLSSFSQNCLQTPSQGCSSHWPCLFSHPRLHLEVLT